MDSYDIVFLVEANFPGGASTAFVNELWAAERLNLRCAVRFIRTKQLGPQSAPNRHLLETMIRTNTPVLAAHAHAHARVLLICHPYILNEPSNKSLNVSADIVALIAHHPPFDRAGVEQYAIQKTVLEVKNQLNRDLLVLPVSETVRRSFQRSSIAVDLWDQNWTNLIDTDVWQPSGLVYEGGPLIVGRHARPSLTKWPEQDWIASIYPDDPDFQFYILGKPPELETLVDPWPSNWLARPFEPGVSRPFLSSLHAYSYFHSNKWIEAFGYNVLEAMATGLPTVLPHHFEENFGSGGTYATPADVRDVYARLKTDDAFRIQRGEAARQLAETQFGLDQYEQRINDLIGVERVSAPLRQPAKPDRILVVTSNGVGVGHISRQLAIAAEQPLGVQTIFFTLSRSAKFAAKSGYVVEQRAFHKQVDADPERWNGWIAQELSEAMAFYQPDAVVFDGNVPYQGLLTAFAKHPEITRIWTRRGMWRNEDRAAIERSKQFDLIVEPADLAESQGAVFDSHSRAKTVKLAPVISLPVERCLSRESARKLLNLPSEGEIALLQLGASTNYDMSLARDQALDVLLSDPSRIVVELLSPTRLETIPTQNERHRQISDYPFFKYIRAFDMVVSACGYNSYHEIMASATPCLFVPNDAPEMDLQEVRAEYARACGWADAARADAPFILRNRLQAFCNDAARRAQMVERMNQMSTVWDGASEAAQHILFAARTIQLRSRP